MASNLFAFFFVLLSVLRVGAVEIELLGDYLTDTQLLNSEFCGSKQCLVDAGRLLETSTRELCVDPCDDFKEFSMGNFIKYRALHDRHDRVGFLFDVLTIHYERQRKSLIDPIVDSDSRIFKIVKNFFQQCIDSDYIKTQGKRLVAEYLITKGFPLLDGADWWPDKFNLTARIQDKAFSLDFMVTHRVTRCEDPRDSNKQIFCWKFNPTFHFLHKVMVQFPDRTRKDFWNMLKEMNQSITVDDAIMRSSLDHILLYFEQKVNFDYPGRQPVPMIVSIKDTGRILTPNSKLNLDWLSVVNWNFLEHSRAQSEDEEILIEDSEIFANSMILMEETAPRIFGDVLFLGFLFGFQHMYVVYPFNLIDSYKRGTKKEYQRFEQCIAILETNCGPALIAVYANKFYNKENHFAAESLIKDAINEVSNEFGTADDLDEVIKNDVMSMLENVFVIAGFPQETINVSRIEELYNDINLEGNEDILNSTIELMAHNTRIYNELKTSWMASLNEISHLNDLKYMPDKNVLYVPAEYTQYPYFDANRSRFFNTATLFTEVVLAVNVGIKNYMRTKFNISYILDYDSVQLGYRNYMKWEAANEGAEKRLPGFSLTNQQMYWLAFANSYYMKYHTTVAFYQLDALNLQYTYFHVWFKARPEFRKAFGCSDLYENEEKEFEMLKEKFRKVHRTN